MHMAIVMAPSVQNVDNRQNCSLHSKHNQRKTTKRKSIALHMGLHPIPFAWNKNIHNIYHTHKNRMEWTF